MKHSIPQFRQRLRSVLRAIREEAGFSQSVLAKKLGKPQTFISKAELGERRIDLAETLAICAACRVSISQFVKWMERTPTADPKESRAKRRSPRRMDKLGRIKNR